MIAMTLADPEWLALVPVVVLVAAVRFRRAPALRFAPASFVRTPGFPSSWRSRLASAPGVLEATGLLVAVLALARPVESREVPRRSEGVDVVLCLDVSSSMSADDMGGGRTRLEVAREAALRFVEGRPRDRIGLVTFARFPDLRCPPTLDHEALAGILSEVAPVPADGAEDATGIGTAVARAAQVLADSAAPSKVVILLTDGEETVAAAGDPGEIAPSHAAQLAERLGVRVHAIAAGVGRRVPGGALVRPDTAALSRLAKRTGGAFHEAPDAAAVAGTYARIDALEKSAAVESHTTRMDLFLPFLVAAAALVLLGRFLGSTVLDVFP